MVRVRLWRERVFLSLRLDILSFFTGRGRDKFISEKINIIIFKKEKHLQGMKGLINSIINNTFNALPFRNLTLPSLYINFLK